MKTSEFIKRFNELDMPYGAHLTKSEYGSAFDDLISSRLVTTDGNGAFVLTKRGVKVTNRISTEIYRAMCHA